MGGTRPIAAAFDDELRDRLRGAASEVPAYVEEVLSLPHLPAHGDACPNNLLATARYDGFTLIDYGFWMPMPAGADLSQLLIGDVQIGKRRAGDLTTRDDAHITHYVRGLLDEGCDVPEEVVRRGHALHMLLMSGLSTVPTELLDRPPSPRSRRWSPTAPPSPPSASQPDRQAGHAPLELLELRDVDDDGLMPHGREHRRGLRRAGGHQQPALAQEDHVRAGLLGHRQEPVECPGIVDEPGVPDHRASGSAVTAVFRWSTLVSGTASTVAPSGSRSLASWPMPSALVRVELPT